MSVLTASDFSAQMVAQLRILDPNISAEIDAYLLPRVRCVTLDMKMCKAPGCDRNVTARKLCASHYKQGQNANDFSLPLTDPWPLSWTPQTGSCIVDECERPKKSRGYCHAHYLRVQRYGDPQADKPIEGRGTEKPFLNVHGYYVTRVRSDAVLYPGQKVLTHRLVMARHLDRELTDNETVHHKNGDRLDNRIENLELWVGNHSHGSRLEDRLADAISLISEYQMHLDEDQLQTLKEIA